MFLAKKITQLILKNIFLVQSDRLWPPTQSQSLNCTQISYEEELSRVSSPSIACAPLIFVTRSTNDYRRSLINYLAIYKPWLWISVIDPCHKSLLSTDYGQVTSLIGIHLPLCRVSICKTITWP